MIITFIQRAIMQSIPLLFGSTGETITEKGGNLNLGIPGIMYVGGISGVIGAFFYEKSVETVNPFLAVLIPLLSSILGSALMGLLYCFLTVTLRANQNVTGLAMTTFGVGFGNFFGGSLIKITGSDIPSIALSATSNCFKTTLPFAAKLGKVGDIFFSYSFLAYAAIIIALITAYFFKHTRIGLQLRAVGENPATSDAAGINVGRYKYISTIVGSVIAGLGGLYYVMDYERRLVEQRLRRPRLACNRARYLRRLEARSRHPRLIPLRRSHGHSQLHPEPQLRRAGAVHDDSLCCYDNRPCRGQHAPQARESAAREPRTFLLPRGSIILIF